MKDKSLDKVLQDKYFAEFRVIDKLSQHPEGLNFNQWLNRHYPTRTKLVAVKRTNWSKVCPSCKFQNTRCKNEPCTRIHQSI